MNEQNIEFPVLVKQLKDNILAHIDFVTLNARIQRAKFNALVKVGFTEDQALKLCEK